MSNITGVLRGGWHPKGKDGGRESWRGDFKGVNQVAGLIGKGKNPNTGIGSSGRSDHVSRPLATLKDPAAFGPPPKNVNFHGGAALPNQITPDRRALGAPLSNTLVESTEGAVLTTEPEAMGKQVKLAGPPVPYRANRTGSKPDHLPPPPIQRAVDGDGGRDGGIAQETGIAQGPPRSKPSPPRLPPRTNSSKLADPVLDSPSPPTYGSVVDNDRSAANTYINQEAANRLGKAGISVPGFGIGQRDKTIPKEQAQSLSSPKFQLNELQTRISDTTSNPVSSSPSAPSQGTTIAEKQAAVNVAQSFHKDPSSVSVADAQSAANVANNFRERHQEQINAGAEKAKSWNKKYNITGRMNSFLEQQASPTQPEQTQQPAPQQAQNRSPTQSAVTPDLTSRKAPPPPPRKPSGMQGHAMGGGQAPPPVPLGTKPSFG